MMSKFAATLLAAMAAGSIIGASVAQADDRGPGGPGGVGVGPVGPYGVGGLGPVAGPAGPVGVGGVVGPVGVNPILGPVGPVGVGGVIGPVGVDPVVDAAVRYAIPYGYPLGPAFPGELPCFTPAGQAYFTPYLEPCLCFAPTGAVVPC
jgi:hypothetical protein